jgi:hypothetical protein
MEKEGREIDVCGGRVGRGAGMRREPAKAGGECCDER